MADRRRRATGERPRGALDTALRQDGEQSAAEREKYGERLNTVPSKACPTCHRVQRMTVHPGHRLYQLCKHAFELPPIGITSCYGRERRTSRAGGAGR